MIAEKQKSIESMEKKLSNKNYAANVPQNVQEDNKLKLDNLKAEREALEATLKRFKDLANTNK